jgi:hypothetical protein
MLVGEVMRRDQFLIKGIGKQSQPPHVQIFYLGLIGGGWLLFASVALPLIPGPYVSAVHRYGLYLLS